MRNMISTYEPVGKAILLVEVERYFNAVEDVMRAFSLYNDSVENRSVVEGQSTATLKQRVEQGLADLHTTKARIDKIMDDNGIVLDDMR